MKPLFASLALLAACSQPPPRSPAAGPDPEIAPADRVLARVSLATDIDGRRVGFRPGDASATVLVVFASWCQPCRHELGVLGELVAAHPRLRVIGINAYEEWSSLSDERRLRRYLAESAPWLQVVRATDDLLDAFGGVPKIPTLFIYDRDGRAVGEFRREQRPPPTRSELEALLPDRT